jgi:haloalkane dehalogenase
VVRTPEERFSKLPEFDYQPSYVDVEGLRMAFVEAGAGDPILLLHGEPTWGYLYRHMIRILADAGRVVVPDLIGFGRSDKPTSANAYSYRAHCRWLTHFIESLDLRRITLVCQDWGGLLGMRVLSRMPQRFSRLVAMNTGIPTGGGASEAFLRWRRFSQTVEYLNVPLLMQNTLKKRELTEDEANAYSAPFPDASYQTGALVFPRLVPTRRDQIGAYENRVAVEALEKLELPVLLPWGDEDPITAPSEAHLRSIFRNVQPPFPVCGAGHFIQEDAGEEVAEAIARFVSTH